MHYTIPIIVPRKVCLKGAAEVYKYLRRILTPHAEDYLVKPYINRTAAEVAALYSKYKTDCTTFEDFATDYFGDCTCFDFEGNEISMQNPDPLYDSWSIPKTERAFIAVAETLEQNLQAVLTSRIIDRCGFLHKKHEDAWNFTELPPAEEAAWNQKFIAILEASREDYIVHVDCHI